MNRSLFVRLRRLALGAGRGRVRQSARLVLLAGLCAVATPPALAAIYSCVDASGKHHTADRPIAECLDSGQSVLNPDGSQKQVLPPRMNAQERAQAQEKARQAQLALDAQRDAARRDRNLMLRYPDEVSHDKAREAALDDVRHNVAAIQERLTALQHERVPLMQQTEFYKGRRLPHALKIKLDANEAQQQAQRDLIQTQESELVRINALYDAELQRLKQLWAGAAPGSLGPPVSASGAHSGAKVAP